MKLPAPILHIPGFTYPVIEYYKEDYENIVYNLSIDIINQLSIDNKLNNNKQSNNNNYDYDEYEHSEQTQTIGEKSVGGIQYKGDINYDLLIRLILSLTIKSILKSNKNSNINKNENEMIETATGAILVFLPGVPEIMKLYQLLQNIGLNSYNNIIILILHSNITTNEQKKIFQIAKENEIRIILSTNVAEASVTIPGSFYLSV